MKSKLFKSSILVLGLMVGAAYADDVIINNGAGGGAAPVEALPPLPPGPEQPKTTVTVEKTGGCEASIPGRSGDVGGGLATLILMMFPLFAARAAASRVRES